MAPDQDPTTAPGHLFARFADAPDLQLLCLPYAGGGTQVFRGWQALMPPGVGVTGIRLPGREQRFRERALDNWPDAFAELTEAVAAEAERGPYAFFGHSLGARLAYELTHRLAADGHRPPELLAVSACRAPGVPPRQPDMHSMDGPTLTARLREMRGVPEEVLASSRMMALLEPVLRADLRLAETWEPSAGPVAAPILALCGEHDDIDPEQAMLGWERHTAAHFALRSFPAGHFFPFERPEDVVPVIAAHLDSARRNSARTNRAPRPHRDRLLRP